MSNVVTRTIWLIVLSSGIVVASLVLGEPATAGHQEHGAAAHSTPHGTTAPAAAVHETHASTAEHEAHAMTAEHETHATAAGHDHHAASTTAEAATASHADHAAHMTVNSELEFIAGMIPHHQEAVDSAQELLTITERPEMRDLAEVIIEAQTLEIAILEGWLAAWYPDADIEMAYEPMMRPLEGLDPDTADRVFLEDMLLHHDMAIVMAESYLAGDFEQRPEVQALAQEIITVQNEESVQMRAWLEAWYGDHDGHGGH